jgi:hypothetical protein
MAPRLGRFTRATCREHRGARPRGSCHHFAAADPHHRLRRQAIRAGLIGLLLDEGEPEKERIEKVPGGYVVRDSDGQALVYYYCGANETEALQANVLTEDEARRLAISIAKLRRRD